MRENIIKQLEQAYQNLKIETVKQNSNHFHYEQVFLQGMNYAIELVKMFTLLNEQEERLKEQDNKWNELQKQLDKKK